MTVDNTGRQGVFDFSGILRNPGRSDDIKRRRTKLPASQCVPKERVQILADVRVVWGIALKDIAANCDLDVSFLSRVLTLKQGISLDEFTRLKGALADIVFMKSLKAAGRVD